MSNNDLTLKQRMLYELWNDSVNEASTFKCDLPEPYTVKRKYAYVLKIVTEKFSDEKGGAIFYYDLYDHKILKNGVELYFRDSYLFVPFYILGQPLTVQVYNVNFNT